VIYIIWGYDLEIYKETGLVIPINNEICTHPSLLLTGSSGFGKSYALLWLMGQLLKNNSNIKIYFCDFKNEDFIFLEDYPYYFAGNSCYDGVIKYYNMFSQVREHNEISKEENIRHLLIFDEYPSCINYFQMQDKRNKTKYSNEMLSAVCEILMLGRGTGKGFGVWIVTQRPDASLFLNGCRDNFMSVIGLGRMSKEHTAMIFHSEEIPDYIFKRGEGLILSDGSSLRMVKYPRINDLHDWQEHILESLHGGVAKQ
jgi:energy-coupling factor transporter ATP-binding protein EcfA2